MYILSYKVSEPDTLLYMFKEAYNILEYCAFQRQMFALWQECYSEAETPNGYNQKEKL